MTPEVFIKKGVEFANKHNLKCKTFLDNELKENNLNLIYAVGKGSCHRPGMLCIEYMPSKD